MNLYYHHQRGMPTIIKAFELHGKFKQGFYDKDWLSIDEDELFPDTYVDEEVV